MTLKEGLRNVAASVRARLLALARERNEPFDLVLTRYASERLLYRLGRSRHRDDFVLKGAALFQFWTGEPHRPTRDLDLLGRGEGSIDRLTRIFREICDQAVEEDGLVFSRDSVRGEEIRERQEYGGVRMLLEARLEAARILVQVDVGFGDAVVPRPAEIIFPVLLAGLPAPELRAYERETAVAEKLQAMVALGIANSRMKDFYDVWVLSRDFAFDGRTLAAAIRATFERRATPPPESPVALSEAFAADPAKRAQWTAFLRRGSVDAGGATLDEVVAALARFLRPVMDAVRNEVAFHREWPPGGPWRP